MISACSASKAICPKQAAVTHSLLKPTWAATSSHFKPLATLAAIIISVTWLRSVIMMKLLLMMH